MGTTVDVKGFEDVIEKEQERIRIRRQKAGIETGEPAKDAVGLALSGGGVRSATFNLGLLQAMHKYGFLEKVDYLSTVSGGGYIGSSLSWFMSRLGKGFPFHNNCKDDSSTQVLRWLRHHASYLLPGQGLGAASLLAAFLRGMFINLLIFFPLFLAIIYLLTTPINLVLESLSRWPRADAFPLLFTIGAALAIGLFAVFFLNAVLSVSIRKYDFSWRREVQVWFGRILATSVALLLLGVTPLIHGWLTTSLANILPHVMSSISITGAVSFLAGWKGRTANNETHGSVAWLLRIGLMLLLFGALLWFYHFALYLHNLEAVKVFFIHSDPGLLVLFGVFVSLFTGTLSNVNLVSMHRYYRDRLLEAYMPEFSGDGEHASFKVSDKCYLSDIAQTGAPYHIINTNMVTVGSDNPKYRARGGDNFILSPEFIGSEATGYASTAQFEYGRINLATAFAISGAAVDPNTGSTRSRPLAFVMTLLNVRLGYWMRNPNWPSKLPRALGRVFSRPFWQLYMIREMFGWGMHEKGCYLHLSDGGHFENLGLYELVRRKCRYIIVADAGADPDWTYGDLARASERIRTDFCAKMVINTQPLHPDPDDHLSLQPATLGIIHYEDGEKSTILFLKTTVFPNLPEDIYGYKRTHDSFPDETTADQFFDEAQFEAYRELGYGTGRYLFKEKSFAEIFADNTESE